MTDLTEFLLARIAEDEKHATAAATSGGAYWRTDAGPLSTTWAHVMRHGPARVLAECAAKRQIVALCVEVVQDDAWHKGYSDGWAGLTVADRVMRDLALPYAGHPDYDRAGWAK